MRKWIVTAIGALLLLVSGVLAVGTFAAQNEARRDATRRIEGARAAAADVLRGTIEDARDALVAWPETPSPPWLRGVRPASAVEESYESFPQWTKSPTIGVIVGFGERESLHVAVPRAGAPSGEEFTEGRIPPDVLRDRLLAHPAIGKPGPRTFTRLQLVGGADGDLLFELPLREGKDPEHDTDALKQVRRGEMSRIVEGIATGYKGPGGAKTLGTWTPVADLPGIWVLVEVRDDDALAETGGMPIAVKGLDLGRANLWHVALGLAVLVLVASVWFWLPSRGTEIGVLLRVYDFAKPYKLGIVSVVLLGMVFAGAKSVRALLVKNLGDDVLFDPGPDAKAQLWRLALATVGLGVVLAGSGYLREYLHNYFASSMIADMRLALGRKIVGLPLSFFNRIRAGDLVARIERDVASTRAVLNQVFEKAFVAPFQLVGAVVVAFVMNWELALVLLGMPLVVYPLFRIAKKIKKRAEKRQGLQADISHVLFQMLMGIKVVKAFRGEQREAARLDKANRRFIHEARRIHRLTALSDSMMDLLQMIGGAVLMVAGGYGVLHGDVSAGELIAFMVIVAQVYDAAKELTTVFNKMIDALPGTQRVFEIFDEQSEIVDGPRTLAPGPLQVGIELRGVHFRYRENEILKGIDLVIPAGKVVALVGPTGAGKTTVCDIVARFYDPTAGQVLYDGVDARECTVESLASKLAIVTQDAFLFNAPIDENIRYGRDNATQEEIEAAARDASIHDEILQMEGGYQKLAGERGSALSGGQRQRTTIARAILKDAPVLILDEATSNLDSLAEQRVQSALARLMKGRTVIVVAHRLSTIRNADKVVVLEDGRVVEEGPPDELLLKERGRFRAMCDLQRGEPDAS